VFYHGEEVARRRRYDSRLLLAHLARLDRLCEARADAGEAEDFDDLLAQLGDPGRAPLGSRAAFVEECAAEAERFAMDALYDAEDAGEEVDWEGGAIDPVVEAMREARDASGEGWDMAQREARDFVDALVAGDAELVVPEDPPVEVKGSACPPPSPSRRREGSETCHAAGVASRSGVGRSGRKIPSPCTLSHVSHTSFAPQAPPAPEAQTKTLHSSPCAASARDYGADKINQGEFQCALR
jgi:hypothetical protein